MPDNAEHNEERGSDAISDELDAMLGLPPTSPEVEEVETPPDPVKVETVKEIVDDLDETAREEEEDPPEEEVEEEEEDTPPEEEEEPEEIDPNDELAAKERQVDQLLALVDTLMARGANPESADTPPSGEDELPTDDTTKTRPPSSRIVPKLTRDQLIDMLEDPDQYADFLEGIVQRTRQEVKKEVTQEVLNNTRVLRSIESFFSNQPDLEKVRRYVLSRAADLEAADPAAAKKNPGAILEQAAKLTREELGLTSQKSSKTASKPRSGQRADARFPSTRGTRPRVAVSKKTTQLDDEIAELERVIR